jgi:hypothetical protein
VIRSRNQNSFLAVATLGVYLGLILAGATPTVLAQAATAKQFNVKDEVEVTENLERKPANADASSDEKLNAKITSSVKRLVSKVRGSASSTAALVILESRTTSAQPPFARSHIEYGGPVHKNLLTDLIGTQNLARAGIA